MNFTPPTSPMGEAVIVPFCTVDMAFNEPWIRDAEWAVWYFGDNYETFLNVCERLPANCTPAPVGKVLSENAQALSTDIANLEDSQLQPNEDRSWWDASDLGDRGPYVTRLLEGAAQTKAVMDAIASGGRHLFVVENKRFARALYDALIRPDRPVSWLRPSGRRSLADRTGERLHTLYDLIRGVLTVASGTRHLMRRVALNRAGRRYHPMQVEKLKACDVILTVWSAPDLFPETGPLKRERYLGALPELLRKHGYKVGYFVNTIVGDSTIEQVIENGLQTDEPALTTEDCQNPWLIVKAAAKTLLAPWRIKTAITVGGVPMAGVLRFERQRELRTWRPLQSRLMSDVGATIRRQGMQPKAVIHNYENQPWEKLLRAGLREHLPATRAIGFQHVPLAPLFINTFPSNREVTSNLIPDHIFVPGDHFARMLVQWGLPSRRITVGGGLRFEDLIATFMRTQQGDAPTRPVGKQPSPDTKTLLCCSSIDYNESFQLVHKVAAASARVNGLNVVVNFHPALSPIARERIKTRVAALCPGKTGHMEYSDAGVRDLLNRADLVAYNTSSSAFDALAQRLGVLCVLPEHSIAYNRVPDSLCVSKRSVDDIAEFLGAFMTAPQAITAPNAFIDALALIDMDEISRVIRDRPE